MSIAKRDFFNLLKVSIESINPGQLIRNSVQKKNSNLKIEKNFLFKNQILINDLNLKKNVYIAAFGKAAYGMAIQMEEIIGEHLCRAIAILPFNHPLNSNQTKIEFFFGGKFNLPDQDSVLATKKIFEMVSNLTENDVFIALVSGGGSALLALPEDFTQNEAHNLEIKLETIKTLVKSGANINDLNIVRSSLSKVKNGKLSLLAHPATTIALVISDVIDDPLEIISSGPCCAQSVCYPNKQAKKALEILKKFNILDKIPEEVVNFLTKKISDQSEKKFENFLSNQRVSNFLIGNNKLATMALMKELEKECYSNVFRVLLSNSLSGEAQCIGSILALFTYLLIQIRYKKINWIESVSKLDEFIKSQISKKFENDCDRMIKIFYEKIFMDKILKEKILSEKKFKLCLISGGETTVNMSNCETIGKGGRNQEMTLAFEHCFTMLMQNSQYVELDCLFSSYGSDGIDGPTDAAGAYFIYEKNSSTFNKQELEKHLERHDSYNYFCNNDRLIATGPTGTNVSDLQILLIYF